MSKTPGEEEYVQAKRELKRALADYATKSLRIKKTRLAILLMEEAQSSTLDRLLRHEAPNIPEVEELLREVGAGGDDEKEQATALATYHAHVPLPRDATRILDQLRQSIAAPLQGSSKAGDMPRKLLLGDGLLSVTTASGGPSASGPASASTTAVTSTPLAVPRKPAPPSSTKGRRSEKLKKTYQVPRDADGKVILPFSIGFTVIHSLGRVVWDRPGFWNERYLYPVGFRATRQYASMLDPERSVGYECEIIDGGEGPLFRIIPEDQPDRQIVHASATGAWGMVLKSANEIRRKDTSNSVSGPDYFAYGIPTVSKLIQELPNTDKCEGFIMSAYGESRPLPAPPGSGMQSNASSPNPPSSPAL